MEKTKKNALMGEDLEKVSGGFVKHYPSSHDDDTLTPIGGVGHTKPKPDAWSPDKLIEE